MYRLVIQFPEDFEERFNKYKNKLLVGSKSTLQQEEFRPEKTSKRAERNRLNFYSEGGEIEYNNETGVAKNGDKDYALLSLLNKNKNTPFNADDIKEHCNPLVNKDAHKFKGEKDIDDTIRQIRSKLKVKKGAYFPITKRGEKENKKWLWIEK